MASLNEALGAFEATESNLLKAEALWEEISSLIPDGVIFGDPTDGVYDDRCRAFRDVSAGLPSIDGWAMPVDLLELNAIAQMRLDAQEIGDVEAIFGVEDGLEQQGKHLLEYRYRFNRKRRELVRASILECMDAVDAELRKLLLLYPSNMSDLSSAVQGNEWEEFKTQIAVLDTLLGGSIKRPSKWWDLQRHIHFAEVHDLHDIKNQDWPEIKSAITRYLYGKTEAIPVGVGDLGVLVASKPRGEVVTKLKWESLDEQEFERLLFCLISQTAGYENPEWLTKTNAPDHGRDLSVSRVFSDSLAGTIRHRVIIQCKHWLSKSVGLTEVAGSKDQMKLWEPPRVHVLIVATSGRFTSDAIHWIEKHNQSDSGLQIETWAESHLERLLAVRPALIAEFGLR